MGGRQKEEGERCVPDPNCSRPSRVQQTQPAQCSLPPVLLLHHSHRKYDNHHYIPPIRCCVFLLTNNFSYQLWPAAPSWIRGLLVSGAVKRRTTVAKVHLGYLRAGLSIATVQHQLPTYCRSQYKASESTLDKNTRLEAAPLSTALHRSERGPSHTLALSVPADLGPFRLRPSMQTRRYVLLSVPDSQIRSTMVVSIPESRVPTTFFIVFPIPFLVIHSSPTFDFSHTCVPTVASTSVPSALRSPHICLCCAREMVTRHC